MTFQTRVPLIQRVEELRNSKVVCYLTSVRQNLSAQISEDTVRVFFDHLLKIEDRPIPRLDVFLCSNGGSSTVPWRLVSLLREYTDHLGVLLPYRAYSAATLLALGADEIVMHPFAEMGPIDPTVSNSFNPIDPHSQQRLGISVEDVKAYISFITSTVGIKHEEELVRAVEILAKKVHPLALGNVERFLSQSRLVARKILGTHMDKDLARHRIDEIIETMASKLFFHGHPINRKEARTELGLKVAETVSVELETALWSLYLDFEEELKNREIFDPMAEIYRQAAAGQAPAQALIAAAQAAAQAAQVGPQPAAPAGGPQVQPGVPAQQPGFLPQVPGPIPAMAQLASLFGAATSAVVPLGTSVTADLIFSIVETTGLSIQFKVQKRIVVAGTGGANEPIVRDETLAQGWEHSQAPQPADSGTRVRRQGWDIRADR